MKMHEVNADPPHTDPRVHKCGCHKVAYDIFSCFGRRDKEQNTGVGREKGAGLGWGGGGSRG